MISQLLGFWGAAQLVCSDLGAILATVFCVVSVFVLHKHLFGSQLIAHSFCGLRHLSSNFRMNTRTSYMAYRYILLLYLASEIRRVYRLYVSDSVCHWIAHKWRQ